MGKLKDSLIDSGVFDCADSVYDAQPERQPEDLIAEQMDWRLSEASTARSEIENTIQEDNNHVLQQLPT